LNAANSYSLPTTAATSPSASECTSANAAQVIAADSTIYQVMGLPTPPGFTAVIPKYSPCRGPSPWTAPHGPLCRIVRAYGPLGVEAGLGAWGRSLRWDPLYRAPMPYILSSDITLCLEPRRALEHALASGEQAVTAVLEVLEAQGVRTTWLGLTGSRALGIAHQDSDVDLVVYERHERVYEAFKAIARTPASARLGGIIVEPAVDASWRKTVIAGYSVTWTPANNLCPPLREYYSIDPPHAPTIAEVRVPPRQETALGYPPCAAATDGTWIVSFEYNLAGPLYEGGLFRVSGTVSERGRIIYLGLRERPGQLLRLARDGGSRD